jgi:ribonuclease P protein component
MRAVPKAASVWLSEFPLAALPLPEDGGGEHLVTVKPTATAAPGRIVQKVDFERMLAVPARQRSTHFALHHLPERPAARLLPARLSRKMAIDGPLAAKLSTSDAPSCSQAVDDSSPTGHWLGTVVPKRHAKRAATRNLVKRQIHHQFQACSASLPPGLWVVRLKAPFAPQQFLSARSVALAVEVRTELASLLQRAALAHGR